MPKTRRKKALILAAGGAQGAFQAGAVQQYVKETGFVPDIICGTSVGALNGAKLAEADIHDPSARRENLQNKANELVSLWDGVATGKLRVWDKNLVVNTARQYFEDRISIGDFLSIAYKHFTGDDPLEALSDEKRLTAHKLHSVHWMRPLRALIAEKIDPRLIARSGMSLRIGVTDVQSGQLFYLKEPRAEWRGALELCGEIETFGFSPEDAPLPDRIDGHPVIVDIRQGIYASATIPVLMDPLLADYSRPTMLQAGLQQFARVPLESPRDLVFLLASAPQRWKAIGLDGRTAVWKALQGRPYPPSDGNPLDESPSDALLTRLDEPWIVDIMESYFAPANSVQVWNRDHPDRPNVGGERQPRYWFDGGLREYAAIATAIRLGAREIVVITGAPQGRSRWRFNPETDDNGLGTAVMTQYLGAVLELWSNKVSRTDYMSSIAFNEFLGWTYQMMRVVNRERIPDLVTKFNTYWSEISPALQVQFNASSWLGGDGQFKSQSQRRMSDPEDQLEFGSPFFDPGCTISMIAPQQPTIASTGFDDHDGLLDAIEAGRLAARQVKVVSAPVTDDDIVGNPFGVGDGPNGDTLGN